jgi:hypothetical protein
MVEVCMALKQLTLKKVMVAMSKPIFCNKKPIGVESYSL